MVLNNQKKLEMDDFLKFGCIKSNPTTILLDPKELIDNVYPLGVAP